MNINDRINQLSDFKHNVTDVKNYNNNNNGNKYQNSNNNNYYDRYN